MERKSIGNKGGRAGGKTKNYVFPTTQNKPVGKEVVRDLRNYISKVQLQRLRHDVQMWRDAISEAEQAYYPHRIKMQRMFIDTILNGHTLACINRRKDLTTLREFCFKNAVNEENEDIKKQLNKPWFNKIIEYILEAKFFGYTLIEMGDLVADDFPNLSIIRRFNISPDRLNVTSMIYSLSGINFLEEPYCDFHIWVPTSTDVGVSPVGYGLLYNVAVYEIICRNLLGNNADAAEIYGMPQRKGRTQKTEEAERAEFAQSLQNMGSAGWILLDAQDEVDLIESKGNGQGFKIYPDLEKRLEAKISKIVLGHSDALDSTPGKLGAGQGGDESPAAQALRDKQTSDGSFVEDIINGVVIPKLINLGFNIDTDYPFTFDNNQEVVELRKNEDKNNQVTAEIAYTMKQAGLKMDAKYFTERTGIPATEDVVVPPSPPVFNKRVKNKLKALYKSK